MTMTDIPTQDTTGMRIAIHHLSHTLLQRVQACQVGPQESARMVYDAGNGGKITLTFPRASVASPGDVTAAMIRSGERVLIFGVEHLRIAGVHADRLSGAPERLAFIDVDTGAWAHVLAQEKVTVLPPRSAQKNESA